MLTASSLVRLLATGAMGVTLAAGTAIGCSVVSAVDFQSCSASTECRDAFGLGWTCDADRGFCTEVEQNPRCTRIEPANLYDAEAHRTTFIMGTLFNDAAVEGDQVLINSAKLAVREANESTLDGRLFGLVHCDYQDNPDIDQLNSDEAAAELARYMVDELGINVLIGPGTSSTAEAVYTAVEDKDVLIISPSATANNLIEIDGASGTKSAQDPGLFWRTAPPDAGVGSKMASLVLDGGLGQTAIIHETGGYGEGLALEVERLLNDEGGSTSRYAFDNPNSANIQINNLNAETFDAVVFISAEVNVVSNFVNTIGGLIQNDTSSPYASARVVVSDAAVPATLIDNSASQPAMLEVFDQMFGVRSEARTGHPVYNTYLSAYNNNAFADPFIQGYYGEHTYDATYMAMFGVAWAHYQEGGELTAKNIARGLWQLSSANSTNVPINSDSFDSVKSSFSNGVAVDIEGASGPLNYDSFTEETAAAVEAWQIVCDPGCTTVVVEE